MPTQPRQPYCADCLGPRAKNGVAICKICKQEKLKVHPEVGVCGTCAGDPKNDDQMHKLLLLKHKWLVANPVVLPKPEPVDDYIISI